MVDYEIVSLVITIIALATAFIALVGALLHAIKNGRSHGITDFRLHMSIVALVWLIGESIALFTTSEVSDDIHFISMIIFVGFVAVRTGLLVDSGSY